MAQPGDSGGHYGASASNDSEGDRAHSPGGQEHHSEVREQDRFLPIANVGRVMKRALPANAKISKDAKETMQECVSEFISFITGEASDKCAREKRKTINGDDILWAMSTLGFDDYIEPLKLYLLKYRETESEKISLSKVDTDKNGYIPNNGISHGISNVQMGHMMPYEGVPQMYLQPR